MYTAERHFVTTAKAQLRLLASNVGGNLQNNNAQTETLVHTDTKTSIHTIKLAAGPVKARAVYRAALLCEDTLNRFPVSSPKFQTSLAGLKSLVGLYTDGLLEIDPDFKSVLLDGTVSEKTIEAQIENIDQDEVLAANFAANENAANTLKPLLKLVRANDPLNALSSLTKFAQSKLQNTIDTNTVQPSLRFEALMRQITNRTLGQARAIGKDISISYAADFDIIEKKTALVLQAFLENTCLQILKTGLPENDPASNFTGRNRTWQISLTGSRKAQDLTIALTWTGLALSNELNVHRTTRHFQTLGGTLKSKTKKQADRDSVNGLDTGLDIQALEITCPATSANKQVTGSASLQNAISTRSSPKHIKRHII